MWVSFKSARLAALERLSVGSLNSNKYLFVENFFQNYLRKAPKLWQEICPPKIAGNCKCFTSGLKRICQAVCINKLRSCHAAKYLIKYEEGGGSDGQGRSN